MKKLLSIIVLVAMCGILCVNVFAAQPKLSRSEAENLALDAIYMLLRTQYNQPSYYKTVDDNGRYAWDWEQWIALPYFATYEWSSEDVVFSENLAGEKIYDKNHANPVENIWGIRYLKVEEFTDDIKSLEAFYEYLESVFCGDLSIKLRYFRGTNRDLVRPDSDGNLLYLDMCDYGFYALRWGFIKYGNMEKITEDKYILHVVLGEHDAYYSPIEDDSVHCYNPFYETVEISNTKRGWRVSGGTAFEVLLEERTPNFNPATGDESAYKIPALTVAALISIALPVSLLKKRRVSE